MCYVPNTQCIPKIQFCSASLSIVSIFPTVNLHLNGPIIPNFTWKYKKEIKVKPCNVFIVVYFE